MLKIKKIKPVLPLLVLLSMTIFFVDDQAQAQKVLVANKEVDLEQSPPMKYNDLTISIIPIMKLDPETNGGHVTIYFKAVWSDENLRKNEGIFIICEEGSEFEEFCKENKWKNKVKSQIQKSVVFSSKDNIVCSLAKSEFFYKQSSPFSIDFSTYPVDDQEMTVIFYLGADIKVKDYAIEQKASPITWSFKLPRSSSKDCRENLESFKNRYNELNPENNKDKLTELDIKSETAESDLKKIRESNKELQNIITGLRKSIDENECTEMKGFLIEIEAYIIPDVDFRIVDNELRKKAGDKKEVEENVQSLNISLETSFSDIGQLYRELFDIRFELGKTGKINEATIISLKSKLDDCKLNGDQAYQSLGADQKQPQVRLLKEGFDQFYGNSKKLLDEIENTKSSLISTGTDDQATGSGKESKGFFAKYWYLIPALIILILAIVLVKYWGTIMKAFQVKKKVESQ